MGSFNGGCTALYRKKKKQTAVLGYVPYQDEGVPLGVELFSEEVGSTVASCEHHSPAPCWH